MAFAGLGGQLAPSLCALFSTVVLTLCLGGCTVSPSPLTQNEVNANARELMKTVAANQEPITRPVDMYEAMARALKYNLDFKVEATQTVLRTAELDLAHFNLLPSAVANYGFAGRNNQDASNSLNILTRSPTYSTSTSQDRLQQNVDMTFTWNILDFGLSYVRAKQAADKVLMGEEMKRKVTHRLLEDVRTAYWRAVSAERLARRLKGLEERTRTAMANARDLAASQETSRITSLTNERELIEIRRLVKELQRDLVIAKAQLAALMNVKPGTDFKLVLTRRSPSSLRLSTSLDAMIRAALRDRAEIHDNLYQQRVNAREAHAAVLEMLPGIQVYGGGNWDSNSFLYNADWVSWGAKASWNLLKVFQYPAKRDVIDMQDELLKVRARALAISVITQVYVSRTRFRHAQEEVKVASEYLSVQNRLIEQIRTEAQANRISEQTLLREEMNTLVGEARYDIAFAALESAYANIHASIGHTPYAATGRASSVAEIAAALRKGFRKKALNMETAHLR